MLGIENIGNGSVDAQKFEEERFYMLSYDELNEGAYYSFWMQYKLYNENLSEYEDKSLCIGALVLGKRLDSYDSPIIEVSFVDDDYKEIARSTLGFVSIAGEVSDICKGVKSELKNGDYLDESSRIDGYFLSVEFDKFDAVSRLSAS